MTTTKNNFVSLIVKTTLLGSALALSFSLPSTYKTPCLVNLIFNSILLLFGGISSDLEMTQLHNWIF